MPGSGDGCSPGMPGTQRDLTGPFVVRSRAFAVCIWYLIRKPSVSLVRAIALPLHGSVRGNIKETTWS